jgi:hypothetical protein
MKNYVFKYEAYQYCPKCGQRCKVNDYECDVCGWEFAIGRLT